MNTRREFLKISSLASAAMLTPAFLQSACNSSISSNGKKLVIIQLSGGNDGLNTVVPYQNDLYYNARQSLGISASEVIKLNDEQGLNPVMQPFYELYDQGMVSVLNAVGYPNPNRSHFRSMDIWHTATDSNEYAETGWLGRYLDHNCAGCAEPHLLVEIDDGLSLAVKGEEVKGLGVRDPQQLYK
ncbi:MAG: twin-arginine translocation pathway signal, partial [Bacteroidota bacterium]